VSNKKEKISNSLNYSIVQLPRGKYEIQGESPVEGPSEPFDKIYKHRKLKHLIGIIPENERFNSSNLPSGEVLSFTNPDLIKNIDNISYIANHFLPNDLHKRLLYQQNLFPIFSKLTTKIKDKLKEEGTLDRKNYVIIPPQKGGEIIAAFIVYSAKQLGWKIPFKKIAYIDEKRLRMKDGNMLLGINYKYIPPVNPNTSIIFTDDCLATNISTKDCLRLIAERMPLPEEEIKKQMNSTAVYAVAHQKSMQELFNELGTYVITGGLAFELDSTFYIKNPDDPENPFKVGDMGEWTKILPRDKYKKIAPWNKERFKLRDFWLKQ